MRVQHKRWGTPDGCCCFLRPFLTMRLQYPAQPNPSFGLSLRPWQRNTLASWRHSSCSVLPLNGAMFDWLRFTDLQILVAVLSQSSHHQPLPAFPPGHTTLGPFSWANNAVPGGHADWGTDVVAIGWNKQTNQPKTIQAKQIKKKKKKEEENKILPILQGIWFLTPTSSRCGLLQSHTRRETVGKTSGMRKPQGSISAKASSSSNHGQGFLSLTLPTRSP